MNDLDGRKLFVVTLVDENSPDGAQPRVIHVPAFVADIATAARRGQEYADNFANTPEGKTAQVKDAKLRLHSVTDGGRILT